MVGEILINVLKDAILFSGIEGFLYCKCYEKIFDLKKFKCNEILVMILGNAIISQIFPPILYQIFMIMWMDLILIKTKKINNNLKDMKFAFFTMLFQLITEMPYAIIFEFITNIDLTNIEKEKLFTIMIPIRIVQIILIYGGTQMKGWLGTGTTRK